MCLICSLNDFEKYLTWLLLNCNLQKWDSIVLSRKFNSQKYIKLTSQKCIWKSISEHQNKKNIKLFLRFKVILFVLCTLIIKCEFDILYFVRNVQTWSKISNWKHESEQWKEWTKDKNYHWFWISIQMILALLISHDHNFHLLNLVLECLLFHVNVIPC